MVYGFRFRNRETYMYESWYGTMEHAKNELEQIISLFKEEGNSKGEVLEIKDNSILVHINYEFLK